MLYPPLTPDELVEVVRRRTGRTYEEVAARLGWPKGTLHSYLHRMRGGRMPTRDEIDRLADALADPRQVWTRSRVIRTMLYSAAGIDPSPDDVIEFLRIHYPWALVDPGVYAYVMDVKGWIRWISAGLADLCEKLGGPPAARVTELVHAWARTPDSVPPDGFRLQTPGPSAEPANYLEAMLDPALGISGMFGVTDATSPMPPHVVRILEVQLRSYQAVWPNFTTLPWFAPVHARLLRRSGYADAYERAVRPPDEPDEFPNAVVWWTTMDPADGPAAVVWEVPEYYRWMGLGRIVGA